MYHNLKLYILCITSIKIDKYQIIFFYLKYFYILNYINNFILLNFIY